MSYRHSTCAFAIPFLVISPLAGAAPDALFAADTPVQVHIAAPIATLIRERPDEEELDGVLTYSGASGEDVSLGIEIRTRGNYRRQKRTCPFAPVRLDFRQSEVDGTLFENQDKLKLVTHCRDAMQYEQAVIREYLTYRMYNQLTDLSYRVRPLTITYVDTDRDERENTRFGFVIEDKERFSARTGLSVVRTESGDADALDPALSALVAVFQYFAGNTDYSLVAGARGDNCCHNTNLFGGEDGVLIPVPYDFDMSGLVDARYASPNPALELRSNRERLYRGHCVYNEGLREAVDTLLAERAALFALIDEQAGLNKGSRKGMQRFLNRFFKTIDRPDAIDDEFLKTCLGAAP